MPRSAWRALRTAPRCCTHRRSTLAANATVFLKCENLQRIGAFKFRGAYNFLASLPEGVRERGVVAFSSGNHAQGVALAARLFGIPATIVMPTDAPVLKLEATLGYGAEVVPYERDDLAPRRDRREPGRGARCDAGAALRRRTNCRPARERLRWNCSKRLTASTRSSFPSAAAV